MTFPLIPFYFLKKMHWPVWMNLTFWREHVHLAIFWNQRNVWQNFQNLRLLKKNVNQKWASDNFFLLFNMRMIALFFLDTFDWLYHNLRISHEIVWAVKIIVLTFFKIFSNRFFEKMQSFIKIWHKIFIKSFGNLKFGVNGWNRLRNLKIASAGSSY